MNEISFDTPNISFICQKCGKCCSIFRIFLTENDIVKIEKLGYAREEFVDCYKERKVIRRINDNCFFLKFDKKGSGLCGIYKHRPISCRMSPLDIGPDKTVSIRLFFFLKKLECPGLGKGKIKSIQSFLKEMNLNERDILEAWEVMPVEKEK